MTEAKSAAGLIDHVLRKHGFYSKAECADIPGTIGADLIAVVLSYAAERERLLAEADAVIDAFTEALFNTDAEVAGVNATHISQALARHQSRLSSRPATEGKGDD